MIATVPGDDMGVVGHTSKKNNINPCHMNKCMVENYHMIQDLCELRMGPMSLK